MSKIFDVGRYTCASLPSSGQRIKQNTLFESLENSCGDCLSDLDLFYNFATDGDSDYAEINWVAPGTFQLTQSGTVTKTSNSDFQGNGTTGYFDTGYIPSTNAVTYLQDDASVFCAIVNDASSTGVACGCNAGVSDPSIILNPRTNTNVHSFRINNPTSVGRGSSVSSQGFFQIQRTVSAGGSRIFKDGSQVGADSFFGSAGLPTKTLPILANNNNGVIQSFYGNKMSCFGLGSSLSGQESAIQSTWNTYFTSL